MTRQERYEIEVGVCNSLNTQAGRFRYSDPWLSDLLLRAQETINKLLEELEQPGWIPCKTTLPKEDGQYNVTVKYEHVDGYDDIYSEHGEWVDGHWDTEFGHCGKVEKVLAWMPLPKPWKGGQNG